MADVADSTLIEYAHIQHHTHIPLILTPLHLHKFVVGVEGCKAEKCIKAAACSNADPVLPPCLTLPMAYYHDIVSSAFLSAFMHSNDKTPISHTFFPFVWEEKTEKNCEKILHVKGWRRWLVSHMDMDSIGCVQQRGMIGVDQ